MFWWKAKMLSYRMRWEGMSKEYKANGTYRTISLSEILIIHGTESEIKVKDP